MLESCSLMASLSPVAARLGGLLGLVSCVSTLVALLCPNGSVKQTELVR
jgi:hypothetical protein